MTNTRWSIALRLLKWSVQVNVLLKDCKRNMTSLSLLADRTVVTFTRAFVTMLVARYLFIYLHALLVPNLIDHVCTVQQNCSAYAFN